MSGSFKATQYRRVMVFVNFDIFISHKVHGSYFIQGNIYTSKGANHVLDVYHIIQMVNLKELTMLFPVNE